jgi:hypothetical protein
MRSSTSALIKKEENANPNQRRKSPNYLLLLGSLPVIMLMLYLLSQSFKRRPLENSPAVEPPLDSSDLIFQRINRTCSTVPFAIPNKPKGQVVSSIEKWAGLDTLSLELEVARNEVLEIGIPKSLKLHESALGFVRQMKQEQEQAQRFFQYSITIGLIREIYALHKMALELGKGNCGEHAAYVAFEIIKLSVELGQNIKVARVEAKHYVDGSEHSFVMVDSDIEFAMPMDSKAQVSRYTNHLISKRLYPSGFICDPWNEGVFIRPEDNENSLYKLKNKKELNVATYYLDFDYKGFSKEAVKFLNDGLEEMGLKSLYGKPTLRFLGKGYKAVVAGKVEVVQEGAKRNIVK